MMDDDDYDLSFKLDSILFVLQIHAHRSWGWSSEDLARRDSEHSLSQPVLWSSLKESVEPWLTESLSMLNLYGSQQAWHMSQRAGWSLELLFQAQVFGQRYILTHLTVTRTGTRVTFASELLMNWHWFLSHKTNKG